MVIKLLQSLGLSTQVFLSTIPPPGVGFSQLLRICIQLSHKFIFLGGDINDM